MGSPKTTANYDYLPYFYSRIFNKSWKLYGTTALKGKNKTTGVENAQDYRMYVVGSMNGKILGIWTNKECIQGIFLESGTDPENVLIKNMVESHFEIKTDEIAKIRHAKDAIKYLQDAWAHAH